MRATWNFLAAGHGKGPAGGIGAVIKRTADLLISNGKDIPDAICLFESLQNHTSVQMYYVTADDIKDEEQYLSTSLAPIPGTMKIHQLTTTKNTRNNTLSTRLILFPS